MRLTERDRRILEAVHAYDGVLSFAQLRQLFFTGKSQAEERLKLLFQHGYLNRPTRRQRYSLPDMIYWLDKKGAALVAGRQGMSVTDFSWCKNPRWSQVEHDLAVVDFRLELEAACERHAQITLETWVPESEFWAFPDRVTYEYVGRKLKRRLRPAVANSLAWLVHPATETPLLEMLVSKDEQLSQLVAEHFALNGDEGWKILREAVNEEDFQVRRVATYGLALIDEPWSREALTNLIRNEDEWIVKAAATNALESLEQQHVPQPWAQVSVGDQSWLIRWAASQGRAVPAGQAAMPVLLEVLASAEDLQMRVAAANSLGRMGLPGANKALQQAAQSEDSAVRDPAYNALALINRAHPN